MSKFLLTWQAPHQDKPDTAKFDTLKAATAAVGPLEEHQKIKGFEWVIEPTIKEIPDPK